MERETVVIKLNSVSVAYELTNALNDINFEIISGEKIALIGPSGAGKTTLLQKIYTSILNNSGKEPGFIHQDFALIEQLSVFHNVYMGKLDCFSLLKNLRNFLIPAKEMIAAIKPILIQLGLTEKIFIKAGELSGGEKQRLAIARCMFKHSDVILADEPVASVDHQHAKIILQNLLQAAPTVVISIHSTDLAMSLFTRIVALKKGCIVYDGRPEGLSEQQVFELFQQ